MNGFAIRQHGERAKSASNITVSGAHVGVSWWSVSGPNKDLASVLRAAALVLLERRVVQRGGGSFSSSCRVL
jgi:hypothetical protein